MNPTGRTTTHVALYIGLALTVVATVAPFVDRATTGLLAEHIRSGFPAYSAERVDAAVTTYLVILTVVGVGGALGWITTAWGYASGKGWVRWAAAALAVTGILIALTLLFTQDKSGEVGLAPALGWLGALPCLPGLVAVGAMWRRPRVARP